MDEISETSDSEKLQAAIVQELLDAKKTLNEKNQPILAAQISTENPKSVSVQFHPKGLEPIETVQGLEAGEYALRTHYGFPDITHYLSVVGLSKVWASGGIILESTFNKQPAITHKEEQRPRFEWDLARPSTLEALQSAIQGLLNQAESSSTTSNP